MSEKMVFDIVPTAELSIKYGGKRVGYLEGISLDFDNMSFLKIPAMTLAIRLYAKEFAPATLNRIDKLIGKLKVIKLTIVE